MLNKMEKNKNIKLLKFFCGDFRKDPKTPIFCAYCQKDLNPKKLKYFAFLDFSDAPVIIDPKLVDKYTKKNTLQVCPIGSKCAKELGEEWLLKLNKGEE